MKNVIKSFKSVELIIVKSVKYTEILTNVGILISFNRTLLDTINNISAMDNNKWIRQF